jgi:hypothetical protein
VVWLTAAIVLLSVTDLYITMLYLRSVGMGEANPVARFVMQHGTPAALVLWKLGSVGVGCMILLATRRSRSAEIGAWICCAALVWLTLHWTAYSREIGKLTPVLHRVSEVESAKWVQAPDQAKSRVD